jgi:DNA-binding PadR family transcriptional regulator
MAVETIQGDKLRGHLETMVLAVLDRDEAHGLEILRRLDEAGCGLLRLKEGSLYPALYRLEEAGHVEGKWEQSARGRRGARRRIYRLTSKGKRELAKGREAWASFVRVMGAIMGAPA